MNLKEIAKEWLTQHLYHGLFTDDCGCEVDDLMPCGSPSENCEPGYKLDCNCGDDHDFHIGIYRGDK